MWEFEMGLEPALHSLPLHHFDIPAFKNSGCFQNQAVNHNLKLPAERLQGEWVAGEMESIFQLKLVLQLPLSLKDSQSLFI